MATTQIQEALEACNQAIEKATAEYSAAIQAAEASLRTFLDNPSSTRTDPPNPGQPDQDQIILTRDQFNHIQNQLELFKKVVEANPEMFKGLTP